MKSIDNINTPSHYVICSMTNSDGISNASDSSLANIPTNTFEPLGIDEDLE